MRKLYLIISATFLAAVIAVVFSTRLLPNIWLTSTGRGFTIPPESSLFSFRATLMNSGSGEWWLYGRDQMNFYSVLPDTDEVVTISLKGSKRINGFDPHDYSTW